MEIINIPLVKEEDYIRDSSCPHVRNKKAEVMKSFELLHSFYIGCVSEHWDKKAEDHICSICKTLVSKGKMDETELLKQSKYRVHACLHCVFFGCYTRINEYGGYEFGCHIRQHAMEKDHPLAMDINSGQVLCLKCGDFMYDPDIMAIAQKQKSAAAASKRRRRDPSSVGIPEKWEPSPDLISILEQHTILKAVPNIRGLENVVQNCYLNIIIQCLIAAPLFRDYLLSFDHRCSIKGKKPCCVCSVTDAAQKLLSEKKEPALLAHFIYNFTQRCPEFTLGLHQDAFDSFIELLKKFHEDETADAPSASPQCQCVIHKMFQFRLKTKRCYNVDCGTSNHPDHFSWTMYLTFSSQLDKSLKDILKRTWHEMDQTCDSCKGYAGCTDQCGLPYIMNFCVNYITEEVEFEEKLDMSPYIVQNWKGPKDSKLEYQYYLFAVVQHLGQSNCGHYLSFIRKNEEWFECSDTTIKQVPIDEVLKVKARILFYHRTYL